MIRRPARSSARLGAVAAVPLLAAGLAAGLTACGSGSAAAPTDYARPTTTFTTEPVRTTTTTSAPPAAQVNAAGDVGDDPSPGLPDGIVVDPLTGQWTYEIVRGDNPGKLSQRFGVSIDELAAANADTPGYSSYLIGAVIIVPNPAAVVTAADPPAEPSEPTEPPPPGATCADGTPATIHEIVRGDNPSRLASRYGVTIEDLAAANADTPGYSSYLLGTRVVIPC